MEAAKEKVLNIGATAKSGKDKTKATAEEKVVKMKTRDPLQKEMAEQRKEENIRQAELEKQQAYKYNALQKGEAHQTGLGGHHTEVGHQAGLVGNHTEVGHLTSLDGHHTVVGQQTALGEPTVGPIADTETNPTGQGTGGGLY